MSILTEDEINAINVKYGSNNKDNHMQKLHENLEKVIPWTSVKNNNKTNKFKKMNSVKEYRSDPYKFMRIPNNMREIILNLCKKHNLTLQTLAVKSNLRLSLITNYIENNSTIDNYYLDIILQYLNFDLIAHIDKLNNEQ
tara:strand:+ start:228 stop:647 length:420 start_codon:yes stop_codon:yes gene_type:complete